MIEIHEVPMRDARIILGDLVRQAEVLNDRVLLGRYGQNAVAVVSLEDLAFVRANVRPGCDDAPMNIAQVDLTISEARADLANVVNAVELERERVLLHRHGRAVAALVSWGDFCYLKRNKPLSSRDQRLLTEERAENARKAEKARMDAVFAEGEAKRAAEEAARSRSMRDN